MRAFIGFLMQDEAGLAVTVSGMTPNLIKRFIAWRSGAHSYAVPWKGKHYNHTSKGIKGERSEEHTSELQSLMRSSYAVFCLKKKKHHQANKQHTTTNINS